MRSSGAVFLPEKIEKDGRIFVAHSSDKTLSGLCPKAFYASGGDIFIAKIEKQRKLTDIYPPDIAPDLYQPEGNVDTSKAPSYQQHLDTLLSANMCTALIASRLAAVIFEHLLIVPVNYLCLAGDHQTPVLLSKLLPEEWEFSEFLELSPVIQAKLKQVGADTAPTPAIWQSGAKIKRADFNLSSTEAQLLGQLYFVALLLGHWDVVNNISLTNSGSVNLDGCLKPAIVDWGNCLGVGFGGLSADATAFKNYAYAELHLPRDHRVSGYAHCFPFDEVTFPLLPRQIVKDLFSFDNRAKDGTAQAMFQGFKEAFQVAHHRLTTQPDLFVSLLETVFTEQYIASEDVMHFRHAINASFFFPPTSCDAAAYTLENVIRGRLRDLEKMIQSVEAGHTMQSIAAFKLRLFSQHSGVMSEQVHHDCKNLPSSVLMR